MRTHRQSNEPPTDRLRYRETISAITILTPVIRQVRYWFRIIHASADTLFSQYINYVSLLLYRIFTQQHGVTISTALKITSVAIQLANTNQAIQSLSQNRHVSLSLLQKFR